MSWIFDRLKRSCWTIVVSNGEIVHEHADGPRRVGDRGETAKRSKMIWSSLELLAELTLVSLSRWSSTTVSIGYIWSIGNPVRSPHTPTERFRLTVGFRSLHKRSSLGLFVLLLSTAKGYIEAAVENPFSRLSIETDKESLLLTWRHVRFCLSLDPFGI